MKDEELWNKILLVVQVGDVIRFKYGRVDWHVRGITLFKDGRQWIKLYRHRRGRMGWMVQTIYKEILQGTEEYRNVRIVKGG